MQSKLYANRHGKAENPVRLNKFQLSGDVEEARAIVKGDKDALKELREALRDALNEDE